MRTKEGMVYIQFKKKRRIEGEEKRKETLRILNLMKKKNSIRLCECVLDGTF